MPKRVQFSSVMGLALLLGFLSACQIQRPGLVGGLGASTAKFVHTGTETTCTACHEKDRPAPTLVNGVSTPHGGGGDCVSCHMPGAWLPKPGSGFSHNPLPASCNNCHMDKKPVGLVPVTGTNRFNHALPGLPDCKECHSQGAGTTWALGTYSHSPMPQTCNLCHVPDRPTALVNYSLNGVPHSFDHSISGMGDCISCHTSSTSWAGGQFTHSPKPTTCSACHLNQRPVGLVNGFNHAIAGTGDCVNCHWKTGTTPVWSGGSFTHSSLSTAVRCDSCHLPAKPASLVPPNPALNQMDHSMAGLPDCRGCHTSGVGVSWANGVYGHNPVPATCANCHMNARPVGVIQGFDHAVSGTGDCKSCHTNPGVTWAGGVPHAVSGLTASSPLACASCHGQGGTAAVKLSVPAANHMGGTVNTCISCHANFSSFKGATTSTTSPLLKYAHSPTVLNNDCQICHSFAPSGSYTAFSQPTWSKSQTVNVTGTYNNNSKTITHVDPNLTTTITVNGANLTAQNCKACHEYHPYATSGTYSTASGRWGFTHKANGINSGQHCKACH